GTLGRLRAFRRREAEGRSDARSVSDLGRAAGRMAEGGRAAAERVGRERAQGRRRSGRGVQGAEGVARQVQRRLLTTGVLRTVTTAARVFAAVAISDKGSGARWRRTRRRRKVRPAGPRAGWIASSTASS